MKTHHHLGIASFTLAAMLAACGGGGASSSGAANAPTEGALAASQPGELLTYVRDKLRERQAQRTVTPGVVFFTGLTGDETAVTGAAPATASATAVERSGTVVQEQGVDEDDLIKTDGNVIYTLTPMPERLLGKPAANLQLYRRAADGSLSAAGKLALVQDPEAGAVASGMMLAAAAQRVAVLGATQTIYTLDLCAGAPPCGAATLLPYPPQRMKSQVLLDVADVSDAQAPKLASSLRIDGRLLGSRLIGNTLYLVTQHAPELAVEALPLDTPQTEREAMIARLAPADLLPTIRVGAAVPTPLVTDTDCYVQPKNGSYGIEITTITAIDLSSATLSRASRCFVGGSEALYMSPSSLYLATTRHAYMPAQTPRFPGGMSSDVHKFALSGMRIDYRGSGEVEGHLGWDMQRKSYRMSEWNGDLRVLSFTGETGWFTIQTTSGSTPTTPPSPATLTILRERASDKTLQPVAKLPNAQRPQPLGKPGEQVYAVRFLGNRGYVVTFRRTDPLYVLDLSNPADPRAVGELEITGFSDYLFPITDALLLGVGKDADAGGMVGGVKVALFDVADASRPRQLATLGFGERGTTSGLDMSRHGIDLFTRGDVTRVALPLSITGANYAVQQSGLQRMEVDSAARTLKAKPMITRSGNPWDLGSDRSVQIGDQLYYFNAGQLLVSNW